MKTRNNVTATVDPFLNLYDIIQEGDRIAFIEGPGFSLTREGASKSGIVVGKGENRWGRFVEVEIEGDFYGRKETINGLVSVGIGAYYVGPPSPMAN